MNSLSLSISSFPKIRGFLFLLLISISIGRCTRGFDYRWEMGDTIADVMPA